MALFEDSFTTGSNESLVDHTPDVGSAWTLISGESTNFFVNASDSTLRSMSSALTAVSSDDLGSSDCYVEGELSIVLSMPNRYVALRMQDSSNFIGWVMAGTGGSGMRLVKVVGGVITNLIQIQGVLGRVYRVEAEGTTVKFFENGVQQGSDITVTEFSTETTQGVVTSNGASNAWLNSYAADIIGGGGISITEQLKNINYTSLDPVITLTGSISIIENLVNTNYTSLNPVITLTGVISITEQLKNITYTSLNPTIDLTGVIEITESLVNTNYNSLNPTITLTSGAIEIIEQLVSVQYTSLNPSILLTPEPIGIVSTVCFDGVLVELEYNGLQNNLNFNGKSINIEFNGNFNELEFNGTIQTTCNPGSIKTNC